MLAYTLRRLVLAVPTVWGVVTLTFIVMRVMPGDVSVLAAGIDATPEQRAFIKKQLNLDDPLPVQYLRYLEHVASGDLGDSLFGTASVRELIGERLPKTMVLAGIAVLVSVLVAVPLGVLAATTKGGPTDVACQVFSALSMAAPGFWIALLLVYVFAETLQWLPALGDLTPKGLVMPVATLALPASAILTRMTRATLLDVLHEDFIRTARAKGLPSRSVVVGHALRNALIPVITVVGLQAGFLLGGTIIIETIFSFPGIGLLVTQAITRRDFPVIQGVVVVIATLFVLINIAIDLSYAFLDPRIKYA